MESLQKLSKKKVTFLEIKEAWNAMILDIPEYRIDFLKDLKEEYNLFLLSNTNSIHQFKYLSEFNQKYNYSFNSLFQIAYYSHEIGLRKPDRKVFDFILKDSNLKAVETFFVDDSLTNIKAAQKMGINTFHIINYNISDCIDKLKIVNEKNFEVIINLSNSQENVINSIKEILINYELYEDGLEYDSGEFLITISN